MVFLKDFFEKKKNDLKKEEAELPVKKESKVNCFTDGQKFAILSHPARSRCEKNDKDKLGILCRLSYTVKLRRCLHKMNSLLISVVCSV